MFAKLFGVKAPFSLAESGWAHVMSCYFDMKSKLEIIFLAAKGAAL